jgi:hypothetical protein
MQIIYKSKELDIPFRFILNSFTLWTVSNEFFEIGAKW